MRSIAELQQDKSFRARLIIGCVAIALVVSGIYVVVSYRLAADLGMETELASLERQARLFHGDLMAGQYDFDERALKVADKLFFEAKAEEGLYISVSGLNEQSKFSHGLSADDISHLLRSIEETPEAPNGFIYQGDKQFIWVHYPGAQYDIVILRTTMALDASLVYVAKRLSITTLVVFWISIWSALTLSSLIASRVQQKNKALARLATHDSLTGLPNRLFLVDYMEQNLPNLETVENNKRQVAVQQLANGKLSVASLFVIDLDKFKEVNDSLGHSAGDQLLIEMAKRIGDFLTKDQLLVRTGGDEFLVWAPDIIGPSAELLAKQLVAECTKPFAINNLSIHTGASIGIAYFPRHAPTAETLIVKADTAMYEAKRQRCGWMVCDDSNLENARDRLKLRADLGSALGLNQIIFYFQPKVDICTGEIIGAEALARWKHPTEGVLSPFHFIDLIERSGRVQEFGRYVLDKNIAQLASWCHRGLQLPIAVNLSPYNLLDPGLVDYIRALLHAYDVPPELLEIELTESETSMNMEDIERHINELKSIGVRIAIDDFGTGMSSLSYISNLEINVIKIDRLFVSDMETNPKHHAVVSAAIMLANSFGAKLVAEGIEEASQAKALSQLGCHYGQGYYYSRPVPADEFFALLGKSHYLPLKSSVSYAAKNSVSV